MYMRKNKAIENKIAVDDFYGALICIQGYFSGKIFIMREGEKVTLGSDGKSDIFIIEATETRSCCVICYDDKGSEYIVQPLHTKTVFMDSGQPLGKNRKYCIPRGMVIYIDNKENRFRLG